MNNTFKCPNCGEDIEISEALKHQFEESVRAEESKKYDLKIEQIKAEAEEKARKEVQDDVNLQIKDKENENEELKVRNQKLGDQVLDLNKNVRELIDQNKRRDLETQKKIGEESEKAWEKGVKEASEKKSFEVEELKKKLSDTEKALIDAQSKAKQSSQQLQGEVLELDLERALSDAFPEDEIVPVAKGKQGADVVQKVKGKSGRVAGIILWEAKRAQWKPGWESTLRDNVRNEGAGIGVLVTTTLPKDIESFRLSNGVITTSYKYALSLAGVLRRSILQISVAKQMALNTNENLEFLYQYIQSEAFRHRFEAFAEGIQQMKEDLDYEKSAMERVWKKRETQIQKIQLNASRMYGDLQGAMGNSLPDIKAFSLPTGEEEKK